MTNTTRLFSLFLLFYAPFLLAQPNKRVNVWYFGGNAGLDFNTGTPTLLTNGALNTSEGCASICDENGNLLFYTDGSSIWNKNHSVVPNAINLGGDDSASDSGVIVPQPDNPNRYFVFSVDAEGGSGGVQYAVVDMTLNGGLGGLVSKNNRLLSKASEKLTAIKHCNNKDIWVIVHEVNNNSFRAYLITSNGISTTSVESKIGSVQGDFSAAIGCMKASTNGQKIAVCSWSARKVELFDFDNKNGTLSNVITFQDAVTRYAYGAEFSPNNQYLYVSSAESKIIHQFEVNVNSDAAFVSSRVEIGVATSATGTVRIGALQIAPNNLIYVALDGTKYLGVINKPDLKGVACSYVEKGLFLSTKSSKLGLPNSITNYFKEPLLVTTSALKGANCNDITLSAKAAPDTPNLVFQWFLDNKPINGATQSSFKPTQSGNYFVSVKEANQCISDSAKSVPVAIFILTVNPKIVSRTCGSVKLQANANSSLTWSANGIASNKVTQDTLTVSGSGTQIFKVRVTNPTDNTCFIEKEISVDFTSTAAYSFGKNSISACDTVTLFAPTNINWNSYIWSRQDGTTVNSNKILIRQSGQYIITVKNTTTNCEAKDIVNVIVGTTPTIKSDEKLCLLTAPITIEASAIGTNLTYEWSPGGSKNASLTVTAARKYQVKATTAEGCSATRSIEIGQTPIVDLGNDVILCEGGTVEIRPKATNLATTAIYHWSTGETTSSILSQRSGLYTLSVQQSFCQATDSINVTVNPTPKIKPNEKICLSATSTIIDAGATGNNLTYEWLPSNTKNSSLVVTDSGTYQVKVTSSEGCSATRSIEVLSIPIFDLGNDITMCEGNVVELKPKSSNLSASTTFLWTTGETTQSIIPKASGTYKLSINQGTCQASDSVKVTINTLPKVKADEIVCLEKTIEAGGLENNLIYEWQGSGETNSVIQVLHEGIYNVKISNQFGCSKTRTITVSGPCNIQIFAPTAFTPNNDGINDIFNVIVVGGEGTKLDIYNRWGTIIYSEENLNPKWDGMYQGKVSPNGTYPYVLTYKALKSDIYQKFRGTILIP